MKKKKELSIINRCFKGEFRYGEGEYSSLEYQITASGKIIQEMYDMLTAIEDKYPKKK